MSASFPAFLDVFRRRRKTRFHRLYQQRSRVHGVSEQLEQRLALAVSVLEQPISKYLVVVADDLNAAGAPTGVVSNAYVTQVATSPQALLVADNSAFRNDPANGVSSKMVEDIDSRFAGLLVTQGRPVQIAAQPFDSAPFNAGRAYTNGIDWGAFQPNTTTFLLQYNGGTANFAPNGTPTFNGRVTNGLGDYWTFNFTLNTHPINPSWGAGTFVFTPARNPQTNGLPNPANPAPVYGYPHHWVDFYGARAGGAQTSVAISWNRNAPGFEPLLTEVNYGSDNLTLGLGGNLYSATNLRPSAGPTPTFTLPPDLPGASGVLLASFSGVVNTQFNGSIPFSIDIDPQTGRSATTGLSYDLSKPIPLMFNPGAADPFSLTLGGQGTIGTRTITGTFDAQTRQIALEFRTNYRAAVGFNYAGASGAYLQDIGTVSLDLSYVSPLVAGAPAEFVVSPGLNITRPLAVELSVAGSTTKINSPLVIAAPNRASLRSSNIVVNAAVNAGERLVVDQASSGTAAPENVVFNAAITANVYDIRMGDDPGTPGVNRGKLLVTPTGSLVGATTAYVQADSADVIIEGRATAPNQTYLLRSPASAQSLAPFYFTTTSPTTGADTGLISATNLAITLGNDLNSPVAGGAATNIVKLHTAVDSIRMTAASRGSAADSFPYDLSVNEDDDLAVDAVPASSGTIGITAGGALVLNSALATDGNVAIAAGKTFTVSAPLTTTRGQIGIAAQTLTVSNSLRVLDPRMDPVVDDIVLTATGGSLNLTGAVSAVNNIRLVQRNSAAPGAPGSISGPARVIGRGVRFDAAGSVDLRTGVDFLDGNAGGAVTLDELDDITISSLQAGGRVTLRAGGVDPGLGNVLSPNGIALTASLQGVTALDVSAPNGSLSVITNTDRTLALGNPQTIAARTATSMVAGGSVEVRSVAGQIDVADAPIGGSGGVTVRVATAAPLPAATFAYNSPGLQSSTLTANSVGPLVVDGMTVRVGDRVLVRNQVNPWENGVYLVTVAGSNGPPGRPWILTRATDVDTTDELPANSIVRVTEGTVAGNVFKLGYTPSFGTSPLVATTVANRSGAARVRVATTAALPGTYSRALGTISGTGPLPAIDGATLAVGNRVLVRLGAQATLPAGLPSAAANGVFEVTSTGGIAGTWMLTRAIDVDTGRPIETGYVAVSEGTFRSATTGQGFRLGYDSLGIDPLVVTLVSGGRPATNIGSNDFADTVTFVVSSAAGTNDAAGSLGKMIRLRQANDTSTSQVPQQKTDFRFSSLINAQIVLAEELPQISKPLTLDGAVASRYVPPGTAAGSQPISINGASITTTNVGTGVFRSVGTATVVGPTTIFVPGTFPNFEELRVGMTVQGVGIVPGSRIASIDATSRQVTLTAAVEAALNASVTVTFATEVNGFQFMPGSTTMTAGSRLANMFIGGFSSGAAVRITAPAVPPLFGGAPYTVAVDGVTIGESSAGARLPNEFGVIVAGSGSARITNGGISSSEGAAIRTQDAATGVVLTGMRIGRVGFPNVIGVDLAGSGTVDVGSTTATPTASLAALRNTVAFNRVGVVLRAGTNRIVNTTISDSSFDGVQIAGGNYQIGGAATRDAASNEIVRNGDKAIEILAAADPANPQTDSRRIQGNFLSITANGTSAANLGGTIYASSIANTRRLGLRPRGLGVDLFGNLHGARPARPVMYLATPLDNVDGDLDSRDDRILVTGDAAYTTRIALGIEDGVNATNDASVAARAFIVQYSPSRNVTDWSGPGVTTWAAGTNYTFGYDSASRQVNIDVPSGFAPGSYRIVVDNSGTTGVRDTSGNAVLNNDVAGVGTTAFLVVLDYSAEIVIGPATPSGTTLFVPGQSFGRNVRIINDGDIVIQGVVEASGVGRTISVTSTNGRVLFDPAGELRASAVSLSAVGGSQLRVGAGTVLSSATVSAGGLELMGMGALQQTGPITARSLVISQVGGAVNLGNAGNAVDSFAVTAGRSGAPVTFVNSRGFAVVAGTAVTAGTAVVADGGISLQAMAGDLVVDGRLAAPGDIAYLRAAGRVILGNTFTKDVQMLVIQDSLGTRLDGSFLVADAAGLAEAVAFINNLPAGTAPCRVTIVASFTLDQTLTFNRPVILSAQSPTLQIRGSATVANGLIFSATAANSSITGLSFAQFAGTALTVEGARNLAIQGITVVGGGTGLRLIGDMTGATVAGSRFQSMQVAMRLENLRNATIGGTAVARRNRIEGAVQAGVFATGFCTGTQIIGTTFSVTPVTRFQFKVGSSRGLRIVGTLTAR